VINYKTRESKTYQQHPSAPLSCSRTSGVYPLSKSSRTTTLTLGLSKGGSVRGLLESAIMELIDLWASAWVTTSLPTNPLPPATMSFIFAKGAMTSLGDGMTKTYEELSLPTRR
jgi:hypothetical protein